MGRQFSLTWWSTRFCRGFRKKRRVKHGFSMVKVWWNAGERWSENDPEISVKNIPQLSDLFFCCSRFGNKCGFCPEAGGDSFCVNRESQALSGPESAGGIRPREPLARAEAASAIFEASISDSGLQSSPLSLPGSWLRDWAMHRYLAGPMLRSTPFFNSFSAAAPGGFCRTA